MAHTFVLLCSCLWCLDGVFGVETDEIKMVYVMEGDSVTLDTDVSKIQGDDLILWRFGAEDTRVADVNRTAKIISTSKSPEGFRNKLHLDDQTGSLTITNIKTEHSGLYKAQIIGNKVSRKMFNVIVYAPLPIPVITSYCPQNPSSSESSSKCVLVCSVVNVRQVTLSWYKGNSLFSSISVSDLNSSLSLPLEVEYQENNTYSCVINNPIRNQTKHLNITEGCQTCSVYVPSDCVCSCDTTEAVIRLVVSALMGVAAVAAVVVLVYDIRSRKLEQKRRTPKSPSVKQ
ncbi:SLAM family member 5-like [Myxocyprinus asiaticus]|uniref:SLAM family member 5-like n=1 Tax=Myxocyprinus asiaticus TaxID=70543 RepID=UPI002222D8EF|nr:SLAM family member 5-like [Myxocyprinus asiaticus]